MYKFFYHLQLRGAWFTRKYNIWIHYKTRKKNCINAKAFQAYELLKDTPQKNRKKQIMEVAIIPLNKINKK